MQHTRGASNHNSASQTHLIMHEKEHRYAELCKTKSSRDRIIKLQVVILLRFTASTPFVDVFLHYVIIHTGVRQETACFLLLYVGNYHPLFTIRKNYVSQRSLCAQVGSRTLLLAVETGRFKGREETLCDCNKMSYILYRFLTIKDCIF